MEACYSKFTHEQQRSDPVSDLVLLFLYNETTTHTARSRGEKCQVDLPPSKPTQKVSSTSTTYELEEKYSHDDDDDDDEDDVNGKRKPSSLSRMESQEGNKQDLPPSLPIHRSTTADSITYNTADNKEACTRASRVIADVDKDDDEDDFLSDGCSTILDYHNFVQDRFSSMGGRDLNGPIWENCDDDDDDDDVHGDKLRESIVPRGVLKRECPNPKIKTLLPILIEPMIKTVDDGIGCLPREAATGDDQSSSVVAQGHPSKLHHAGIIPVVASSSARKFLHRRRTIERFWEYMRSAEKLDRLREVLDENWEISFYGPQRQVDATVISVSELINAVHMLRESFPDLKFMYDRIDQSATNPNMLVLHDFVATGTHTGAPYALGGPTPLRAKGHRFVLDECETYFYFGDDDDDHSINDNDDNSSSSSSKNKTTRILRMEEVALGETTGLFGIYTALKRLAEEEEEQEQKQKHCSAKTISNNRGRNFRRQYKASPLMSK